MKDFLLLFRMDITTKEAQPTAEQMKAYMEQWMEWINSIAAKGQLAEGGNHLSQDGTVIKHGQQTVGGPYIAAKESVAGYIIVHANDMNDAVSIAQQCPILHGEGNSVEVREIATPG